MFKKVTVIVDSGLRSALANILPPKGFFEALRLPYVLLESLMGKPEDSPKASLVGHKRLKAWFENDSPLRSELESVLMRTARLEAVISKVGFSCIGVNIYFYEKGVKDPIRTWSVDFDRDGQVGGFGIHPPIKQVMPG